MYLYVCLHNVRSLYNLTEIGSTGMLMNIVKSPTSYPIFLHFSEKDDSLSLKTRTFHPEIIHVLHSLSLKTTNNLLRSFLSPHNNINVFILPEAQTGFYRIKKRIQNFLMVLLSTVIQ